MASNFGGISPAKPEQDTEKEPASSMDPRKRDPQMQALYSVLQGEALTSLLEACTGQLGGKELAGSSD